MPVAEAVVTSPELVLSQLDSLPTLPPVALRLLQITSLDDTSATDVVRLLKGDQSLTAKILSVAGSAAFGTREPVTTLERAVPLLGFATVRSLALAAGIFQCFARGRGANGAFDQHEFWKHALAVACAARRLARERRCPGLDPEDSFVAGLLHDLGKVALDAVFPKAYDRIASQCNQARGDIADHERVVLGADHTVAGRRLAERWRLPPHLQEAIWLHHLSADALPKSVSCLELIGIVQLADTIAREQRIGYSGNYVFYDMSPRLGARLGFSAENLANVVNHLASDVAEHAALLGLDVETPEGVYVQAMTRANSELARLNAELLTGNRRLSAAARYFKAITSFERTLTNWADPSAVVDACAAAAAGALQRPQVAAFGWREPTGMLDLSWTSELSPEPGHATRLAPADLAEWLKGGPPDSCVVTAPGPVRALVAELFCRGDRGTPWLLPIVHRGTIAGGLVFVSEADERERLSGESEELRSFLASLGLALGRANAQAAAQRLSEDLAETNRRLQQVQSELLRSRTLSMIAEMAAGAGHELNTPLSVISGRAQMLAATIQDPESRRVLQMISDKAHECSGIVTELMDFARPRPPQAVPLDARDLLTEAREEWLKSGRLTATRLRLDIPAEFDAAASRIAGDLEQLKTVLRELISNAADAVDARQGTIVLRLRSGFDPEMLELQVVDDGCGMAPVVLQRAFDPFFSHRAAGRGRGLGLARAYRIVEAHAGRIWLESQPDEGTTVHVLLPRRARNS